MFSIFSHLAHAVSLGYLWFLGMFHITQRYILVLLSRVPVFPGFVKVLNSPPAGFNVIAGLHRKKERSDKAKRSHAL